MASNSTNPLANVGDPNDPAVYGPVNGVFVTYSAFIAYEQGLVDANARAAAPVISQIDRQYGLNIPIPQPSTPAPQALQSFTGDCQQPNRPGFPGWATFADAAAWANACTATPVTVPPIPPTSPATPSGASAGRGAPAAGATAVPGAAAAAAKLQPHAFDSGFYGEPGSYCDYYPDDPLCDVWNGGGVVLGGGGGGVVVSQPVIIQQGLSATDVHGLVDSGLSTVWSAVVGAIDATVLVAIAAIQDALTALGNAIKAAFAMLSRLGGFILNALKSMLNWVLHSILQVLQDMRNILKHLATDVLLPIAKWIVAQRDRLIALYKRFIRPLIIVIQDIRRVLNILAIFHVPFAQKLDGVLANLERRITAPLLLLLRYTNQVANWLNLIVTANYLLQKPIFLASLNAYKGESINLLTNTMNKPASPAAIAAASNSMGAATITQTKDDLSTYLASGGGVYAQPIASAQDTFSQALLGQG
jgi:hypothetical protein